MGRQEKKNIYIDTKNMVPLEDDNFKNLSLVKEGIGVLVALEGLVR